MTAMDETLETTEKEPQVNEINSASEAEKPVKEKAKNRKENHELKELRKQLAEKEQLYKENQEKILYVRAEFENFKKRVERDQAGMSAYAKEQLLLAILPVIDNFDRAAASYEITHSAEEILKGFQLIHKQFIDTLSRLNVEKIECKGQAFDPARHDAMMHQETDEFPENTIIDVCQPGYKFGEKIIRHSQVIIAKKPEVKEEGEKKEKE